MVFPCFYLPLSLQCLFIDKLPELFLIEMEIHNKKKFQLPQLLGRHKTDWPNVSLDSLAPNLIAKLPYVLVDSKMHERNRKNKGTITVFKELTISPAVSALSRQYNQDKVKIGAEVEKMHFEILKLPKVAGQRKRNIDTNLKNASYIEIVDDHDFSREVQPPQKEITSPYHITTPIKNIIPLYEYLDCSSKVKDSENQLDIVASHYKYPEATNPFCIGKSSNGRTACAWRDSQKEAFLWESRYASKRIHDNFAHSQLETYFGKKLADFEKKDISNSKLDYEGRNLYHYPVRYLPTEHKNRLKAGLWDRNPSNNLEFFLELSDLKSAEKSTLSRLQTAVDKMIGKEKRYKRKAKLESRDKDSTLIRKLYELTF